MEQLVVSSYLKKPPQKILQLAVVLFISSAVVYALCLFFEPRWETNDDVGMSMVAHGYGLVETASPNLIFSNVLYGYFVRAIPSINGIPGYSIATLGTLVIFGSVVLLTLRRLGFGWAISIATLSLVIVRPVLFPQFTINAGLLAVSAILCWHLYAEQRCTGMLIIGCVLTLGGYLVRSQEFLLVLLVALPLLPIRKLFRDRGSRIATLCLLAAIGCAQLADYEAYKSEDWRSFTEINRARAPYTDFGAGSLLLSRPDVYQKYGYSKNDVQLITSWGVYADPELAKPNVLESMLFEIGFIPDQKILLGNVLGAFKALSNPSLLSIFVVALIFLCAKYNLRAWLVLGAFFVSVVAMGLLGRPGIVRVYYPLVVLTLFAPIVLIGRELLSAILWRRILPLTLFIGSATNSVAAGSQSLDSTANDKATRAAIVDFPDTPVIVWGGGFPFEAAYPVLNIPETSFKYALHGFGVFSPAPFSVAARENRAGRGLANKFTSPDGIRIIANDRQILILAGYCKERLNGEMITQATETYGPVLVRVLRCEVQ
ncbi:hypothetical protein [Luteibacter jiangsuensis]